MDQRPGPGRPMRNKKSGGSLLRLFFCLSDPQEGPSALRMGSRCSGSSERPQEPTEGLSSYRAQTVNPSGNTNSNRSSAPMAAASLSSSSGVNLPVFLRFEKF